MRNHLEDRAHLIDRLRRELVGPDPQGEPLLVKKGIEFTEPRAERDQFKDSDPKYIPQALRPWRDASSGEEILTQDRPSKRYGVGVLYPSKSRAVDPAEPDDDATADQPGGEEPEQVLTAEAGASIREIEERGERRSEVEDPGDLQDSLSATSTYLPSALGVSFLVRLPATGELRVSFRGGRYVPFSVRVGERSRRWWRRVPVSGVTSVGVTDLRTVEGPRVLTGTFSGNAAGDDRPAIDLAFHLVTRRHVPVPEGIDQVLLTVTVINRSPGGGDQTDELCVFQSDLVAEFVDGAGQPLDAIAPYPRPPGEHLDAEEEEIELLYRDTLTFAVGHGCAADWRSEGATATGVLSRSLPVAETPSITPDIFVDDELEAVAGGRRLEVRMAALAGLLPEDDGSSALRDVVSAYERWIEARERSSRELAVRHRPAATRHLQGCRVALKRMKEGLETLQEKGSSGSLLRTAFRLANHAMCLQRVRTQDRSVRRFQWDADEERWATADPHPISPTPAMLAAPAWRPFQVAFLLMALPSVAFSNDPFRDAVDLIWFPTGGGKTEAYLGLAAFAMFLRRLRAVRRSDPSEDAGVEVIMRYTLRLLTAQQFQRAAALLCAMEHLRRTLSGDVQLGSKEFALGMWTGATPNSRSEAKRAYKDLRQHGHARDNIIVLERCPWCRAEMGLKSPPNRRNHENDVLGYMIRPLRGSGAETAVAACYDVDCAFHDGLPLRFVDDDIYDRRIDAPSMIIGTIDKFAVLAWRPEARVLFGRDDSGAQASSPPGLILQDELHLIAGPLGTLVGLYETAIEHLCTDTREHGRVKPKIVASTATIRSYREQVRRLYARDQVYLFPPPGLEAADSFFARHALDTDGRPMPGRAFVGVHAPGLGSVQTTQVRTFSCLLQAGHALPEGIARDPWWTLLVFYNSLRELGGGLTLFHSDVPDYLWGAIRPREGLTGEQLRKLYRVEELTGRLENQEVVSVISKLEVETTGGRDAVDVCLASNIIEVGVDIDRLSLLAVVGQPKSTAQYIQVTGRIGRRWEQRPGLVVTIYSPSKPRDRSHYERFRTYHQQLYAQVEPTSVTPFSPPALERGLHGALVTFVRQMGGRPDVDHPNLSDSTVAALVEEFANLARDRRRRVDQGEHDDLENALAARRREWAARQPRRWQGAVTPDKSDIPLLRRPGQYANRQVRRLSWLTPTSMRNVDAECRVGITTRYVELDAVPPEDDPENGDG